MAVRREIVTTIRAEIFPDIRGTQSLLVDAPKEAVKNLAEELGFREERIVDWLMNNISFKAMLYEKLFNSAKDVEHYTAVQEPFTRNGEKPGDIDLIAFSDINKAIGFECKIVKATSKEDGTATINKAEKLLNISYQANAYLKFGFSQVYLLIVILDDGRNYTKPNFIFNSTAFDDLSKVYVGKWKEELNEKIGIIYCTIEQTRNLRINMNNNISLRIDKHSIPLHQNDVTTKKLANLKNNIIK